VGAGKTTLAREVHRLSDRSGPLVIVGAGELTDTLYADRLFGHVAGAFTGAKSLRRGALAQAKDGTFLLDDVAVLKKPSQAAILRVLESGKYRPLGAARDEATNCRFIFASTAAPWDLVDRGVLLPDLASRLGELLIPVSPLRGRGREIMSLATRIANELVREHGLDGEVRFAEEAQAFLRNYSWPSNIRELRGVVERAVIHAGMRQEVVTVQAAHLPDRLRELEGGDNTASLTPMIVEQALRDANGNQSEAARRLGVHRNTIARYVRRIG